MDHMDHKRCKKAYHEVGKYVRERKAQVDLAKFKAWAMKFPSMVQSCGLIQTVAFYQDKSKEVYEIVETLLTGDDLGWPPGMPEKKLMERLIALQDVESYRIITRQAIAYMTWVKRAVSVQLADVKQGD